MLSSTEGWADVSPRKLPPAVRSAVDIQFSDGYLDTFGLLYACIERGEMSQRVLELTEKCIELCSSHYTAWDYRFKVCCLLSSSVLNHYQVACVSLLILVAGHAAVNSNDIHSVLDAVFASIGDRLGSGMGNLPVNCEVELQELPAVEP